MEPHGEDPYDDEFKEVLIHFEPYFVLLLFVATTINPTDSSGNVWSLKALNARGFRVLRNPKL